jgi:NADPH-dependent ferric siderophore reductase
MIFLGKMALGFAAVTAAAVGLICSEGMVEVKVSQKRPEAHNVYVIAPALLAPMAVHFIPSRNFGQAFAGLRPWMPAIRAALDQLRQTDDVTLVEVTESGQHVKVAKRGGSVVADIADNDETVHVSTPLRAICSTIEQIAAASADTTN